MLNFYPIDERVPGKSTSPYRMTPNGQLTPGRPGLFRGKHLRSGPVVMRSSENAAPFQRLLERDDMPPPGWGGGARQRVAIALSGPGGTATMRTRTNGLSGYGSAERVDRDVGFWSETRSFVTTYGDGPVVILNPYYDFTLEVGEGMVLDLYGVFSSEDGSPLTYTSTNSDHTVVRAMVVELEYLDLFALSEGTAEITLLADNGSGGTATSSFLVTVVTGVPTAPRHELPDAFALAQNHPNPFSRTTNITFDLPQQSAVTLKLYDMLGKQVAVLAEGMYSAGRNHVVWDAAHATNGVYLYRLEAGSYSETRSLTVRK